MSGNVKHLLLQGPGFNLHNRKRRGERRERGKGKGGGRGKEGGEGRGGQERGSESRKPDLKLPKLEGTYFRPRERRFSEISHCW